MPDSLQLELCDFRPPAEPEDIDRLIRLLSASGVWLTAAQITEQLGWSDRKIRALAASSHGLIISGNSGYKHTRHASPEEFSEFYGRMVSQGKEMIRRAIQAKRTHHAHVG